MKCLQFHSDSTIIIGPSVIYMNSGQLLTCQCHGAERFVKKCHFCDLFSVDGSRCTVPPPKSTKLVFMLGCPGREMGSLQWRSMLEFRMSRQLYILRSQGHQQIDKMKGFRGGCAEL